MAPAAKRFRIGLGSFDLIKGCCLLIIILGHSANCYNQDSRFIKLLQSVMIIGTLALPLFMLVSGYGFREGTVTGILKKTYSELLVPYMLIGAAYVVICPFSYYPVYHSWQGTTELAKRYFFAFLFGNKEPGKTILGFQMEWNTAAWFFLALFVAQNLLNLIIKIKSKKAQWGCILLFYMLYLALSAADWNLFCICDGLGALPLCYAGYLLKKYRLLSRMMKCIWTYAVLIPLVILLYIPTPDSFILSHLFWLLFSLSCGILTIIAGILIGNLPWTILEPFKNIGTYSYWILSVHAVEMMTIPWSFLQERLSFRLPIEFGIEIALKALIITVCCVILKKISLYRSRKRMAARVQASAHS